MQYHSMILLPAQKNQTKPGRTTHVDAGSPEVSLTPTTPPVDVFGALPSSPEAGGDWDWTEKGLGGKLLNFLSRKRLQKPNPGPVWFPWLHSLDLGLLRWHPSLTARQAEDKLHQVY